MGVLVIKDEAIICEFKVLYLSRIQLVNQIDNDPSVYNRTIDAYIKAPCQSIKLSPKHPQFIETVFGSGYRFIGEPEQ